jgi:hypothetical protein
MTASIGSHEPCSYLLLDGRRTVDAVRGWLLARNGEADLKQPAASVYVVIWGGRRPRASPVNRGGEPCEDERSLPNIGELHHEPTQRPG